MYKKTKQKGFTLAELMIVLAILGVVAAVVTPTVFDAMPDKNRLKFKKGYYTLQKTIDTVLNSERYTNGYLGMTHVPSGSTSARIFCNAFQDSLNTMYDNCNGTAMTLSTKDTNNSNTMDTACGTIGERGSGNTAPKFITQDGIYWWGFDYSYPSTNNTGTYGIVCFDVDGPGGEAAYGFGVRNDGRTFPGARAQALLNEAATNVIQN